MTKQKSSSKAGSTQGGLFGIWIQSNQLNQNWLPPVPQNGKGVVLCLIESVPALTQYHYHKKRIVLILSLMRHFVKELRQLGYRVVYYQLDDPTTEELCEQGEEACLKDFIRQTGISSLQVMEATEYDPNQYVHELADRLKIPVDIHPNTQFLINKQAFAEWYATAEDSSMETFYRKRRRETGILMQDEQPLGGRWNYDTDNRVSPTGNMPIPDSMGFPPDEITHEVITLVEQRFPDHVGEASLFILPATRNDVLKWMQDFVQHRLRLFGMYQDAMLTKSCRMYHSFLSPYLNQGILTPQEVLEVVLQAYHEGEAPINSVEGFIRQVLGWREYFYGIYWMRMPEYREVNFLAFTRPIPAMMGTSPPTPTHMKCLTCVVEQSRREGYAHHIQRLMVVGNFALLIGIEPDKLLHWMMGMYLDAAEWSAIPNIMGMTLYADGGQIGSKPYAASAHYTDKMSDYCHGCYYRERKRVGEKACPLNFLYWHFVGTHQEVLKDNPRMQTAIQMYRHKPLAERNLITSSAQEFLRRIDQLGSDKGKLARAVREPSKVNK
jgi:deoxyribodipyrimidine photolyase-related protein